MRKGVRTYHPEPRKRVRSRLFLCRGGRGRARWTVPCMAPSMLGTDRTAAPEPQLSRAAHERRDSPTAQAVRRVQSIVVDEWNESLLSDLDNGSDGRSQILLVVLESLGHALRAWVAYGHAPTAIGAYYTCGTLGEEHQRVAELIATYLVTPGVADQV